MVVQNLTTHQGAKNSTNLNSGGDTGDKTKNNHKLGQCPFIHGLAMCCYATWLFCRMDKKESTIRRTACR